MAATGPGRRARNAHEQLDQLLADPVGSPLYLSLLSILLADSTYLPGEHARDQDTCLGTEGGSSEGRQGGGEGREVLDGAGEDGVSVWREERGGVAWGRGARGIRWLVEKLQRDMPTSVGEVAAAVLRQLEARHGEQVPHTRSLTHSLTHSLAMQPKSSIQKSL